MKKFILGLMIGLLSCAVKSETQIQAEYLVAACINSNDTGLIEKIDGALKECHEKFPEINCAHLICSVLREPYEQEICAKNQKKESL